MKKYNFCYEHLKHALITLGFCCYCRHRSGCSAVSHRCSYDHGPPVGWCPVAPALSHVRSYGSSWGHFRGEFIYPNWWFVLVIASLRFVVGINTTSDVSNLLYIISRAVKQRKFWTILKYHVQIMWLFVCTTTWEIQSCNPICLFSSSCFTS